MEKLLFDSQLIAHIAKTTLKQDFGAAKGVSFHSAKVKPGDAFFALPGENMHGIRFADSAIDAGAAFVVSDKEHTKGILVNDPIKLLLDLGAWARAQISGNLIAVTGSAGKTSTKTMISTALNIPKSPGNFNTPLALAQTLIENVIDGHSHKDIVLELGIDHPGEMDELVNLAKPDYAVLTLIAASHLLGLKDLKTVANEKLKLLKAAKFSLVSSDAIAFVADNTKVKSYGLNENNDYFGKVLEQSVEGQLLDYKGNKVRLPVLSESMAKAAVAALALAEMLSYKLKTAIENLESLELEPGRLQIKKQPGFIILDDSYNSSPAAARQALDVLRSLPKPHIAVLGDMLELGEKEIEYHQILGKQSQGIKLVTIGALAKYIAKENPNSKHFMDIEQAKDYLLKLKKEGTILIKASRGMRFERITEILEVSL